MQADFLLPVPLSAIDEGRDSSVEFLKSYISKLNRTHALFLCAKLNLLTSTGRVNQMQTMQAAQTDALRLLYSDGLIYDKLIEKLQGHRERLYQTEGKLTAIFSRQGLLELIRCLSLWGVDSVSSTALMHHEHVQKAFMCALLSCSDLFMQRQGKLLKGATEPETLTGKALEEFRRNYQPMMRLMVDFASPVREALYYLGRARMLLVEEFFNKNQAYADEFERAHDGLSVEDYTTCSAAIMCTGLAKMKQDRPFDSLLSAFNFKTDGMFPESEHMREPFNIYIKFKSQTPGELAIAFGKYGDPGPTDLLNLKPIRQRPILRTGEGIAIVLDEKLFSESVSVGPMFALLGSDKKRNRQIFADFGQACHRYADRIVRGCDDLLPAASRARCIVYEPEGVYIGESKSARSLGDIAVLDVHNAALFETKGSWFNEAALKSAQSFWDEIYRLYGISIEDGETKRRGYAQLADAIKLLSEGRVVATGSASLINEVARIFPVLLAHDELMVQPFLAHLLALDFVREFGLENLPQNGSFQVGKYEVHSLIVMSFNDLEMLQARQLEKSINCYLREYSKWTPERAKSLNEFFWECYAGISRRSANEQLLLRASTEKMNEVAKRCFGKSLPGRSM